VLLAWYYDYQFYRETTMFFAALKKLVGGFVFDQKILTALLQLP
jgi:hypothetical protein